MALFKGDETPKDIIILAYGMEQALGELYSTLAERINDQKVVGVFTKLADLEKNHKQMLFDLYLTLDPNITDKEAFEAKIVSKAMEGGYTTEEYLLKNRDSFDTETDAISIAMMLETEAQDLYMRYSEKAANEKTKTILFDLAEQEKNHLSRLGRLMEDTL